MVNFKYNKLVGYFKLRFLTGSCTQKPLGPRSLSLRNYNDITLAFSLTASRRS